MAIAAVQQVDSGQQNAVATKTSQAVSFVTPVSGHILIAYVQTSSASTIATPTGWTRIEGTAGTADIVGEAGLFWRLADGTEGVTLTFTSTGLTRWCVWLAEYSGVDTSTPIAASNMTGTPASETLGASNDTEVASYGELHICFIGVKDTNTDATIDAATRTDNPRSAVFTASVTNAIYHRTSNTNDSAKIWLRPFVRLLSGTDFKQTQVAEYYGASVDVGLGCAVSLKPANATAVSKASGSGTAAFVNKNQGAWTAAATTASVSLGGLNTVVGHLLVIVATLFEPAASVSKTISTPAGWTLYTGFPLSANNPAANNRSTLTYVFYRYASSITDDSVTLTLSAAGDAGGWLELDYSGPFAFAVGAAVEEGSDSNICALGIGTTAVATDKMYEACGGITTQGDSLQIAAWWRQGNGINAATGSFTSRVNASTLNVPNAADRSTLVAGASACSGEFTRNGVTASQSEVGIIVGFKVNPSGGDHWGWAEGSDSMDSWAMMPA